MPKPVCVKCQRFFKVKRQGVYVLEQMPTHNGATPGTSAPDQWKPYKIWMADLHQCPSCRAEIISGYGYHPVGIQHEEDFPTYLSQITHTVNDC